MPEESNRPSPLFHDFVTHIIAAAAAAGGIHFSLREHQGPVFVKGEVIEIKGGKFRVNGFSKKRLYLDSLPS